jgi:hypothetical protein
VDARCRSLPASASVVGHTNPMKGGQRSVEHVCGNHADVSNGIELSYTLSHGHCDGDRCRHRLDAHVEHGRLAEGSELAPSRALRAHRPGPKGRVTCCRQRRRRRTVRERRATAGCAMRQTCSPAWWAPTVVPRGGRRCRLRPQTLRGVRWPSGRQPPCRAEGREFHVGCAERCVVGL